MWRIWWAPNNARKWQMGYNSAFKGLIVEVYKLILLNVLRGVMFLLTYLLTPWCRVLLEKLTDLQLVKKFPAFYGTRRFITALTSFRHMSLSCSSPIQSTYPHPTSWRSILLLSTNLRLGLPSGLFPSGVLGIIKCWSSFWEPDVFCKVESQFSVLFRRTSLPAGSINTSSLIHPCVWSHHSEHDCCHPAQSLAFGASRPAVSIMTA